jgi:tRNA threonylcarbamoyladenosine biosynthesis protein TsaB
MHEVYVAAYEHDGVSWHERVAPAVVKPEAAPLPPGAGWLGVGNAFAVYPALRLRLAGALADCDAGVMPTASAIGTLALPRFAAGEGVPARDAAPLYVRHRVALTTAERAAGSTL